MEGQKIRTRDTAEFSASDALTSTYERVTHARADFPQRLISLWMIDFDDCTDITMHDRGVDMAVKAFVETNHSALDRTRTATLSAMPGTSSATRISAGATRFSTKLRVLI
jgi:hypothetical protein